MSEPSRVAVLRHRAARRGLQIRRRGHVYELRDSAGVTVHVGTFESATAFIREPMRLGPRPSPLLQVPAEWAPMIGDYLATRVAAGQPATTIRLRREQLNKMARDLGKPPVDVSGEDLVAWLAKNSHWAMETRRGARTAARLFFLWAYQTGRVPRHIADDLPKIRQPKPSARPAPDDVWREALMAADPRSMLILRLAGQAGLRRSEICQIHTRDLVDGIAGAQLLVHGKGGKPRVIPISDSLADGIRQIAEPDSWLLANGVGGHLSPGWVGTIISRLMPPGWTLHTLRHRFATRAYRGTRNLRAVQVLMGHESIATTERYLAGRRRRDPRRHDVGHLISIPSQPLSGRTDFIPMTTMRDDNASTWRDLTDQLTPKQIAELEYCEREQIPPGMAAPRHHLNHARKMAELNLAQAMFADIAVPPDAVDDVDDWTDYDDGHYQRMFTSWTHPTLDVSVVGLQFSDGRVERYILCGTNTEELTAEESRQVAAALIEAAAQLDRIV
jgi:integrase